MTDRIEALALSLPPKSPARCESMPSISDCLWQASSSVTTRKASLRSAPTALNAATMEWLVCAGLQCLEHTRGNICTATLPVFYASYAFLVLAMLSLPAPLPAPHEDFASSLPSPMTAGVDPQRETAGLSSKGVNSFRAGPHLVL